MEFVSLQLPLLAQSPFAPLLNPFGRSSLAYTGSSLMHERLISSCLSVYLRLKLFLSMEKGAISMYRATAVIVLRIPPNSFPSYRYDKLVIAIGSVSSTHGINGLEHCFQLKSVADAQAIRRRVLGQYFHFPKPTRSSVFPQIISKLPRSRRHLKKSVSGCSVSWFAEVVQPVSKLQL